MVNGWWWLRAGSWLVNGTLLIMFASNDLWWFVAWRVASSYNTFTPGFILVHKGLMILNRIWYASIVLINWSIYLIIFANSCTGYSCLDHGCDTGWQWGDIIIFRMVYSDQTSQNKMAAEGTIRFWRNHMCSTASNLPLCFHPFILFYTWNLKIGIPESSRCFRSAGENPRTEADELIPKCRVHWRDWNSVWAPEPVDLVDAFTGRNSVSIPGMISRFDQRGNWNHQSTSIAKGAFKFTGKIEFR